MALAIHGTVEVTHPNIIWLDFDFECRQIHLSWRFGGKLTSTDVEKSVDLKAIWTINVANSSVTDATSVVSWRILNT